MSIFSFLKEHWILHDTRHGYRSHYLFDIARFLCVLKCFSKYIELMLKTKNTYYEPGIVLDVNMK